MKADVERDIAGLAISLRLRATDDPILRKLGAAAIREDGGVPTVRDLLARHAELVRIAGVRQAIPLSERLKRVNWVYRINAQGGGE